MKEDLRALLARAAPGTGVNLARQLEADFRRERLDLELRLNDRKTVHSLWLRFRGLLFDLDPS